MYSCRIKYLQSEIERTWAIPHVYSDRDGTPDILYNLLVIEEEQI